MDGVLVEYVAGLLRVAVEERLQPDGLPEGDVLRVRRIPGERLYDVLRDPERDPVEDPRFELPEDVLRERARRPREVLA